MALSPSPPPHDIRFPSDELSAAARMQAPLRPTASRDSSSGLWANVEHVGTPPPSPVPDQDPEWDYRREIETQHVRFGNFMNQKRGWSQCKCSAG